ncbi:MAG: metallophosphoesterase family protein [Calditrichaeota bacterium]|nr:metallophosphoesterase family protein [Calditrichota bacterium]
MARRRPGRLALWLEDLKASLHPGRVVLPLLGLKEKGRKNALDVRVRHEELVLASLPVPFVGFRLLLMSDLHIDQDPDLPQVVLERLQDLHVDVACLAGDFRRRILGAHRPAIELLAPIVGAINATEGVFAVRGNHDSAQLIAELASLGVDVLDNCARAFTRQGERLWLAGVDDPHLYRTHDVAAAMRSVPPGEFTILLAHSPEAYVEAAKAGVSLYLCGHTHGGQVLVPGIGSLVKNMRAPMAFHRGFWRYDGMLGFTSTGVGSGSVFARFNCPPEMVVLTLRRGENQVAGEPGMPPQGSSP